VAIDFERFRRKLDGRVAGSGGRVAEVGDWIKKSLSYVGIACFLAVVRAAYGVRLDPEGRAALAQVVRFTEEPCPSGYSEVLIVAGRRAGKSSGCAAIACYETAVMGPAHMAYLQPGQRGIFVICAPTVAQGLETFRYALGCLRTKFADQIEYVIENAGGGEVGLHNGTAIRVGVGHAPTLRGPTYIGGILEERAFFRGQEDSNYSAEEIAAVLRMGMLAPEGAPVRRLWSITSPGARSGDVFEIGQAHAHNANAPVLVCHGASFIWNKTLDPRQLEAEQRRDPRRYAREVLAEFVDAINPLLDGASIDRAYADRSANPLTPYLSNDYVATIDFGVRHDSTAMTIAYLDSSTDLPRVVVVGCWVWTPKPGAPLNLTQTIREIVSICREYGCVSITADQFSFDAVKELFRLENMVLVEHAWTQQSKLQKFGLLRDLLVDGRISLPAHRQLISELRQLDETILPSGNVRIAARGRAHDDCAFSLALAVSAAALSERTTMQLWADSGLGEFQDAVAQFRGIGGSF